jgi:hypothetical protein
MYDPVCHYYPYMYFCYYINVLCILYITIFIFVKYMCTIVNTVINLLSLLDIIRHIIVDYICTCVIIVNVS